MASSAKSALGGMKIKRRPPPAWRVYLGSLELSLPEAHVTSRGCIQALPTPVLCTWASCSYSFRSL